jgi:F0F1-type ATP synthase assembly protein I
MSESTKNELAFGKENYKLFIAAVVVVIIGYLLMVGGGSDDPTVFNKDELFSPIRITVAPIIVLVGFGIGMYAIMKKAKD